MLAYASKHGHLPVIQWLVEIGTPLDSYMLFTACSHGYVAMCEWLLSVLPPSALEDGSVLACEPYNAQILELLSQHYSTDKIVQVLQMHAQTHTILAPSVLEWGMKHGMQFDANFFHVLLRRTAWYGNISHAEHLLRLGGVWRAEYFRAALVGGHLAFCKWAYALSLAVDFSGLNVISSPDSEIIKWLASMEIYCCVSQTWKILNFAKSLLPYITLHYPRYVLRHKLFMSGWCHLSCFFLVFFCI